MIGCKRIASVVVNEEVKGNGTTYSRSKLNKLGTLKFNGERHLKA
jgi:hypothetical protein